MVLKSMKPDVLIPEMALTEYLLQSMQTKRDKVALIFAPTGKEYTFGDVADQTIKCASALHKMGLRKGDIVATCASNKPEYLVVILAISACGGIVTTCNPLYTAGEIRRQFEHSQPKFVFCVPGNLRTVQQVTGFVRSIQRVYTIGETNGAESYESLMRNETGIAFFPRVQIDVYEDLAFLPYSSGTTGAPKGVMLTHHNVISCLSMIKVHHQYPSDCKYSSLPLFHSVGLISGLAALDQGVRHVLDDRFDLKILFSSIEKHKVTNITGVPPILLAIEKSTFREKYDLSSLRSIFSGAAPLAPQIGKSLAQKIGCNITQGWGLTEAVPITLNNPLVTPFESVGSVCTNTKIKVIDVSTGEELGPYQDGELCVKGPQIMKGYYKNPEATRATIDVDGWMHTGDIGHYDDNEMIYIVDRLKELIKYKGFQVAPAEVESVLISHPKIEDAAVIGVPDQNAGEVARAFIVRKDPSLTADEVNTFVQGNLSKYKHLHGGIEFCASIPKTVSGKILRRALRFKVSKM